MIFVIFFILFIYVLKSFGIKKFLIWVFFILVSFLRDNLSFFVSCSFFLIREVFLVFSFENCVCLKSNNNGFDFIVWFILFVCMDFIIYDWIFEVLFLFKLIVFCNNILLVFMYFLYGKFFIFEGLCGFVCNEYFFL